MSIENELSLLRAAITENTTALNAVLAAGGAPTNITPITTETPKAKAPAKAAKAATTPEPEPETPTKVEVAATKETEFADPLDKETTVVVPESTTVDVDAVIRDCIQSFQGKMTGATDPERKAYLKEQFSKLRDKYGLEKDAKLITLAPTPEKLVGLLADIKAL